MTIEIIHLNCSILDLLKIAVGEFKELLEINQNNFNETEKN